MKNIVLFLLLGFVAVFVSCNNQPQNVGTELASPVSVESVVLQSISQFINTSGTAKSASEVVLSTEMAGKYHIVNNPQTGRPFKIGDRVSQGQVIVRLEDEEYVNNIGLESVRLNLEITEDEYNKQQSLFEKGGVTQYQVRNAEISKLNAQKNYHAAIINLAKMDVKAPFDGVIADLPYYTEGTITPSNTQVVTLMNYSKIFMEINLPEKNIADVNIGQQALITSYTLVNDTLRGVITELSPMISTETRTFKGTLEINNPDLKLRPGMFVKADIINAQKDSTIVISKDIIMSSNRGKYVFVVGGNNTAEQRMISIGLQNEDNVEVTEGLNRNDQLIINGYQTLRNRSKVTIVL
ncbi:MAG: efflux RND transporter periplasmic adaptor subunit [Bacteroidales bacterium]|jgi:RND family efflux transporter MFP subunit|nr:efflux RND transporter periplasmic adaptor subunit [Bacteroidales bacterium]